MARSPVTRSAARSESVGETRTRPALTTMPDLPPITLQHEFRDDRGVVWARSDFLVGEHLVVEFDGRVKCRARQIPGAPSPDEVVWAEKLREDRIRGQGAVVVRVIWSDLDQPAPLRRRVRAVLRDVARLHGRPVD